MFLQPIADRLWQQWRALCAPLCYNKGKIKSSFDTLVQHYTEPHRYYHNLQHIDALVLLWQEYKAYLEDEQAVLFSIFYHDVVYEGGRSDNEQKSAEAAQDALKDLGIQEERIQKVTTYIEATHNHCANKEVSGDLAFFLDFDLSILAADPVAYRHYLQNVRKEYASFSDEAFAQGRKAFIQKVLQQTHIFFTPKFKQFDEKARQNLQAELDLFRHA